jgi:glycosyltransferase involved in cell wall biosynthesis
VESRPDISAGSVTPPIRVAIFIPHLAIGGSELQLALLARGLKDRGFDPVVFTMESRHDVLDRLQAGGIETRLLPRRSKLGLDTVLALARTARSERFHIVHAWLWAANWRAAAAHVLSPRTHVVLSVRSLEEDLGRWHDAAYKALARLADAVIVNSRAVLERSASRTGLPRTRYRVVRNGVEIERLEDAARIPLPELREWRGTSVVGYLGSLAARKRIASLARIAAALLPRVPEARFLVVGDGESRDELVSECRKLGIEDRFLFAGHRSDVAPWIAAMSVLVHPSRNEGSSNAVLEAQALGVPVVAYAVSGNLETILDGQTGILVPDDDETAFVASTAGLLLDPHRRHLMGSRAQAFIREEFSVRAMVDGTIAAYRSALGTAE